MRAHKTFAFLLGALLCGRAVAEESGFQLDRYQPTPAGQWFFAVEHPWFTSTRWFAGGITLDYGHKPLVEGFRSADGTFDATRVIIEHQLVGHLDLAASFLDRIAISASMPITLFEAGNPSTNGQVAPISGAAAGDPRIGFAIRLIGHP